MRSIGYAFFGLVCFFFLSGDCMADTIKNKETGEEIEGKLTGEKISGQSVFKPTAGGTKFIKEGEWDIVIEEAKDGETAYNGIKRSKKWVDEMYDEFGDCIVQAGDEYKDISIQKEILKREQRENTRQSLQYIKNPENIGDIRWAKSPKVKQILGNGKILVSLRQNVGMAGIMPGGRRVEVSTEDFDIVLHGIDTSNLSDSNSGESILPSSPCELKLSDGTKKIYKDFSMYVSYTGVETYTTVLGARRRIPSYTIVSNNHQMDYMDKYKKENGISTEKITKNQFVNALKNIKLKRRQYFLITAKEASEIRKNPQKGIVIIDNDTIGYIKVEEKEVK